MRRVSRSCSSHFTCSYSQPLRLFPCTQFDVNSERSGAKPRCVRQFARLHGESFLEGNSKSKPQKKSEHLLAFVRYLNDEDLEKYADTNVLLEPVEFTGGKVAVLLRTQELSEGYVRVQISTHFQGNGKPTEELSGQPTTMWPLNFKRHPGAGTDWRAANSL